MSEQAKDFVFDEEARALLLSGIKKLANTVIFTLGPEGRTVILEKWSNPSISNDGYSIMEQVELKDSFENMGNLMAREVGQKIKEKCGDGTTTGILLLSALVENGIKQISAGASPIGIKRGIEKAVATVVKNLEATAIPVKTKEEICNIATVSASGNKEVGDLIAEAMEKVNRNGVITIEEGKGIDAKTTIDIVEGMRFDRGYISACFCTNAEKMIAEIHEASVLLVDRKINNIHELLPVLQAVAASGKELLIIAEDIEGDALSTLVVNRLRGTLKVVAVKAPGFGDQRKALLEDIAILTGATVVSEDAGISLKELPTSALGKAEKAIIAKEHTTIVTGSGHSASIAARLKQIDNEILAATSSYEKDKLQERKAKLSGGVAVIRVGAATESEMKEKKQSFERSLNSTKAAVDEGAVPGGGVALLRASKAIEDLKLSGDEAVGAKIVMMACEAPIKQIVTNRGLDGSVVTAEVLKKPNNFGFNAKTEQVEDLVAAGVIDPAKVVKAALLHASSAAGIIIMSEALITAASAD